MYVLHLTRQVNNGSYWPLCSVTYLLQLHLAISSGFSLSNLRSVRVKYMKLLFACWFDTFQLLRWRRNCFSSCLWDQVGSSIMLTNRTIFLLFKNNSNQFVPPPSKNLHIREAYKYVSANEIKLLLKNWKT